jgi:hypothetical protein
MLVDVRNIDSELRIGKTVLALVTIDTGKNGRVSSTGNTAHWVHVITIEGDNVTIYNPYTNSTEILGISQFSDSWQITPENSGTNQVVIASS